MTNWCSKPWRCFRDDEDEPEELPESSESEDEPRSLASAVAIESLMGINGELVGWLIYLVNNG